MVIVSFVGRVSAIIIKQGSLCCELFEEATTSYFLCIDHHYSSHNYDVDTDRAKAALSHLASTFRGC